MADPYATRTPDLSGRPAGPPPWQGLVADRGGYLVGQAGEIGEEPRFAVIVCRGIGTLAPFSRLDPALGALLWVEHTPAARSAAAANELFARLRSLEVPCFGIKHGCVGGPADRAGCMTIEPALIETVLDAALQEKVVWETDPDFGYELPAVVPAVEGDGARALLPRLLYADHDRAYEHAELVAAKKRERAALAQALSGLEVAISAASGWPPAPRSGDWRE
ncbi:MAG: hypothetical protein H0V25_11945 [Solirubrobacterales bacterium]|nr:hypothetical protein [Solirubrobacterales bacterium]